MHTFAKVISQKCLNFMLMPFRLTLFYLCEVVYILNDSSTDHDIIMLRVFSII